MVLNKIVTPGVLQIISMLPQKKYASIITVLHNMEDLSTMTLAIVIGKIVVFEMSRKMGQEEASSSSRGKALACSEKKKMKAKQVETSSSSSLALARDSLRGAPTRTRGKLARFSIPR